MKNKISLYVRFGIHTIISQLNELIYYESVNKRELESLIAEHLFQEDVTRVSITRRVNNL